MPAAGADDVELVQQRARGRQQVTLLLVHPSEMREEGLELRRDAR